MKYKDLKLPKFKSFAFSWFAILVSCLSLFTIIFTMITNPFLIQITSLLQSSYTYSVRVNESTGLDNYYIFSANIPFNLPGAGHNINADVLMQVRNSEYSDTVSWNASNELSVHGIAVSKNLADRININTGDILHSRHRVRGVVMEYVVEEIISPIGWVVQNEFVRADGVIIMGYDEDYINNISFEILYFTNKPLAEILNYSPMDIIYRNDKIHSVAAQIIPAILVLLVISIVASIVYSRLFVQKHKTSYKRLILLGYEMSSLKKVWKRQYVMIGLPPIIASIIISLFWVYFTSWIFFIPAISACMQIIMFFIMLWYSLKYGREG